MRLSVIVPAYNAAADLEESLSALRAQADAGTEIIVVDDASSDDTARVAAHLGATVLRQERNAGPSAARNRGAGSARGDILFFIDADVVPAPDALARVRDAFAASPELAALFGSYDASPRAPGLVSQYRNLLHHYTHQRASADAFTFWSGCGAIRRSIFEAAGGFDERGFPRSMEDVELGYRLCRVGHRIRLDAALQGKHLKRWTLLSLIRTDVAGRAVPWGRLILTSGVAPRDLNLESVQRWSVALLALATLAAILAPAWPWALAVAAAAVAAILVLNRALYGFLRAARGTAFAIACVPLHLVYFACGALGFSYAWAEVRLARRRSGRTS